MPTGKKRIESDRDNKNTTITLPRTEHARLTKFKEDLEKREEYSWVANLGLGGFIGFVIGLAVGGLAASTKQLVFTCTACKTRVDVTNWEGARIFLPKGWATICQTKPLTPTSVRNRVDRFD